MKARHKDTGEIIELAEEGIISRDGRRFCWYQVELITEPIDECKPSLPSNLDEAAFTYENDLWESGFKDSGYTPQEVSDAFKAGAEWQKKQDQSLIELAEDHGIMSGMNMMKQEMTKKAVEGTIFCQRLNRYIYLKELDESLHYGDKVRVLVIKEDEK